MNSSANASAESAMLLSWRRTDVVGLELLALTIGAERVFAQSTVICIEDGGFRLDHAWELTGDWRAMSLKVVRQDTDGRRALTLERDGNSWRVDGEHRADLDGTEEPDLSVTPFCNTLPIRRMTTAAASADLTLDTAYVSGADLTVARSRQRYVRQGPRRFRYIDLGLSAGFEADLEVDDLGLVLHYQHLFERVVG